LSQQWNNPYGELGNTSRRFVAYGGGVGAGQLRWLQDELSDAKCKGQRCVVFSHCTFHPETLPAVSVSCLMWNFEEVLAVLRAAGNVVATFAGALASSAAASA